MLANFSKILDFLSVLPGLNCNNYILSITKKVSS